MTDAVRVHYECLSPGIELTVYSDGDIVVEIRNQGGFIFEPAQIRELQRALRQLPDTESMDRSLGKIDLTRKGAFVTTAQTYTSPIGAIRRA